MSRINFTDLALSSDQARAARNYFGWPQAKAAEESGLPLHKIKRFESGNYIPDAEFLEALRAFYEKRGYVFDDTPAPGASAKQAGEVFPAGVVGADDAGQAPESRRYQDRKGMAKVHHMRIALQDEGDMGRTLDLIEENEEKLAELLRHPIKTGFFDLADETKVQHAEAVRLLAENGMLFAKLFGREIGGKPASTTLQGQAKPSTTGELLHSLHADAHLAVTGDAEAKDRRKARKPASSISAALGLS